MRARWARYQQLSGTLDEARVDVRRQRCLGLADHPGGWVDSDQLGARERSGGASKQLTPHERELPELITRGSSEAGIADALVIEESTVKTEVKRIVMKLRLHDRVHAVIFDYEGGLNQPTY